MELNDTITHIIKNKLIDLVWYLCIFYDKINNYVVKIFPPPLPNRICDDEKNEWYSICYIKYDENKPYLIEKFYKTYEEVKIFIKKNPNLLDNFLFLHNYDIKNCVVKKGEIVNDYINLEKSKKSILYAEYRHPDMNEPVVFNNINKYCLKGNDLFNPEFILRYLEYNYAGGDYVFDNNYSLIIMDTEFNIIERGMIE